jgi:alanyl-tRNA synthetase
MDNEFDEQLEEAQVVQGLTTKEIKKLIRPTFEADPDRYYPTTFLKSVGFERKKCPIAGHYYWSLGGNAPNCGDSEVVGKYSFIGAPTGIGQEKK